MGDLFEGFLCLWGRVLVGVVFESEFPVCCLDFSISGTARHLQDFVQVLGFRLLPCFARGCIAAAAAIIVIAAVVVGASS